MDETEKPRSRRLEVVIVLALTGLVAFLVWRHFGTTVSTKVRGTSGALDLAVQVPPSSAPTFPSSGALASTFVSGHGAARRLDALLDGSVAFEGDEVRFEAFQDLGPLPYPRPAHGAVGLHAELERTALLEDGEHVHLQIALLAREGPPPPRPRLDVRLVLDRSGSMEGESFRHATRAAHALVDRLGPHDTFGLVSYATHAHADLAPREVGDGRRAHRAIDALRTGGGTNIEDALRAVARHPPERRGAEDVALVMLISDGEATVGATDAGSLSTIARELFDAHGVLTTTVGVGSEFDEDVMLSVAREGNGSYEYVRNAADIAELLTSELDERVLAVAQDLRLRVELAPGVRVARVYGSRVLEEDEAARVRATELAVDERLARERGIASDRTVDVDWGLRTYLPTFRRGDRHVVLIELVVPPGEAKEIARVALDFKDLDEVENRHLAVEVRADRTRAPNVAAASSVRSVERTVLALQAGEALRDAADALARGDRRRADRTLTTRIETLEDVGARWQDDALLRDADTLEAYRRIVEGTWARLDDDGRHTVLLAMGARADERMN